MENDQITSHLIKISEDIGKISGKLDALNNSMTEHVRDDKQTHQVFENRMAALNNKISHVEESQKKVRWLAIGAAAVLSTMYKIIELFVSAHK